MATTGIDQRNHDKLSARTTDISAFLRSTKLLRSRQQMFRDAAVYLMLNRGVTQFIDLSIDMPTLDDLDGQGLHPLARRTTAVAYISPDQQVLGRLASEKRGSWRWEHFLRADPSDVDTVLSVCARRELIDLRRPVGLLAVNVLHYLPPEREPHTTMARYLTALASGSACAITHLAPMYAADQTPKPDQLASYGIHPRSRLDVARVLEGLQVAHPGVAQIPPRWEWGRSRDDARSPSSDTVSVFGGLGVKP
ncbi:SAM-dependent methyltransferase [Lentzea sp. NPDC034063]|uniref:SAM-dependent methyltransferase n=1 Tax=unclassified Lentzea TaxID=2643253 RepID=UPI003409F4BC